MGDEQFATGFEPRGTRRTFVQWALATAATVFAPPLPAEAQASPRALAASLADGRIASRYLEHGLGSRPTGRAAGLVDAPFADVMRTLTRLGNYSSLVPTMRSIEVVSRESGRARVHVLGRAPVLGAYDIVLDGRLDGDTDGTHVIDLRTGTGGAPQIHVRVSLAPTPSGMRTVVVVELALGISTVPAGIGRRAHTNAAIATVAAMRRRVRALRAAGAVPSARFPCPA